MVVLARGEGQFLMNEVPLYSGIRTHRIQEARHVGLQHTRARIATHEGHVCTDLYLIPVRGRDDFEGEISLCIWLRSQ